MAGKEIGQQDRGLSLNHAWASGLPPLKFLCQVLGHLSGSWSPLFCLISAYSLHFVGVSHPNLLVLEGLCTSVLEFTLVLLVGVQEQSETNE